MKSLKEKIIELFKSLRDSWNGVDAKDLSETKGDSALDATFKKAYADGASVVEHISPEDLSGTSTGSNRTNDQSGHVLNNIPYDRDDR